MREKVIEEIELEIQQIDGLFQSYKSLLDKVARDEPDLVERTALASVLHSFYNGVENIFLRVAKGLDEAPPSGDRWHQDLLANMATGTDRRERVLSPEVVAKLGQYLSFRHFYRHSYSFFLDWGALEELALAVAAIWEETRAGLERFLEERKR